MNHNKKAFAFLPLMYEMQRDENLYLHPGIIDRKQRIDIAIFCLSSVSTTITVLIVILLLYFYNYYNLRKFSLLVSF